MSEEIDYDGMIEDMERLKPYILSHEPGFYSNITLEGPIGPPLVIEFVAALYPEEPHKPSYRVFSIGSQDIDTVAIRARLLGLKVRHEIIEKFREVEENWQNFIVREIIINHLSEECRAQGLPICAVIMGKSQQDGQTDASVIYCRSGMPPQIALDMLQEALRQIMAEEQGIKINTGELS
jgi:hypothetical protein